LSTLKTLLRDGKAVIGMVHLLPLPGSAGFDGDMSKVYEQAMLDVKALEDGGVTALMVENYGDTPFGKTLSLEQTAALSAVTAVIKSRTSLPVGVVAAFCDYRSALAAAKASGADFVRLAVFVDTVECFAGILEPCCSDALRYRKQLQAEHIAILADVQVKHSHMLLPHVPIEESATVAESCGADAVIVTGTHTGGETPIETVLRVKKVVKCPVIIGSGVSTANIKEQLSIADGAIVGSSLKDAQSPYLINTGKVRELMSQLNG